LKARFKVAKEVEDQEEMDFGEPPDAFQDPLLFTLMEDPVILPISKITIDRSTIQSHLLSDPHDPFNRTPLKIEDVIPDAERKAEIQAWKEEMRAKSKATKAAAVKAETMDTTEG
jgi:ubiquitin conjugation factor E4 B